MEKYVNIEDVRENLKIFNEHIERLSKRFNQQAGYIVCALFASAWASMFASNPPLVKGRDLLFLVIVTAVIFFTVTTQSSLCLINSPLVKSMDSSSYR